MIYDPISRWKFEDVFTESESENDPESAILIANFLTESLNHEVAGTSAVPQICLNTRDYQQKIWSTDRPP